MIRLSALRNARVCTLDGDTLGRVHEVHSDGGRVVAIMCGPGSFVERLTAREMGRRIPWECVKRIEPGRIVVTPDPPRRKPIGSRSPRRTPRASGPRSKR